MIGLFSQIKSGGEEVRDRAIKFLHLKIKTNPGDLLNREAEAVLLEQISSIAEVNLEIKRGQVQVGSSQNVFFSHASKACIE